MPPEQTCPPVHGWPQAPQSLGSVLGLVQAPLQLVSPDGQQSPLLQLWPEEQHVPLQQEACEQHVPWQLISPAGQQSPLLQLWPEGQHVPLQGS